MFFPKNLITAIFQKPASIVNCFLGLCYQKENEILNCHNVLDFYTCNHCVHLYQIKIRQSFFFQLYIYTILASLFLLQKSSKSYIAKECTHNKSLKNSGNAVVAVYISVRTGYVNHDMLDRVQLNHVMAVY